MSTAPAPSRRVRALFVAVLGIGMLAGAEVAGRVGYAFLDHSREGRLPAKVFLKPYEMADPKRPGNWVPTPGYTMTLAQARKLVRDEGLVIAQQVLESGARSLGVREDAVIFRVNADGYKGPALDRSGARPRVLAVGDSCTFGSLIDHYSWPRAAERELAQRGVPAEVINAGVNGYSPANALARLDEFQALGPRVAVLYVGWNALFGDRRSVYGARPALLRFATMVRMRWTMLHRSPQEIALDHYAAPKHPDAAAPELARLRDYRPAFLADVAALARGLEAGGAAVAIVTLPGLYRSDAPASARALEMGHLPEFTDNPYVIAALADAYNERLRELAAELGIPLIDLDRWSREALEPRDAWFVDSVHLTEQGQVLVGEEVARAIAPLLGGS
jgi:lysophospholipase L1-like esterase